MPYDTEQFMLREGESVFDYKLRCYKEKKLTSISWSKLALIMNNQLGTNHWESYYRKEAKKLKDQAIFNDEDNLSNDLKDVVRQIKKERYKLAEERTQNNAYIRKLSREETIKDIAHDLVQNISTKKFLEPVPTEFPDVVTNKAGILMLSDWHYGIDIKNYFNTYNPDICRQRVATLRDQVIEKGLENNISKLYVVNLSDLISGRIHLTTRLENREDVISQIIAVSEILAEFLSSLSAYFDIVYTDVLDNHSRLEPSKKDSLELETLVRIIPWYLKERLSDYRVTFVDNDFSDDIASFKVFDFNIVAVHGHKDRPNKIIENLSAMTRRRNDLVLCAHYHHFSCDESHETLRISNGSLMGTDTYAQDLRLTNKPSQTLIISTPDNVTHCIYKINL